MRHRPARSPRYRGALKRLHATCGRRIVLRIAHLKMLDQLDPGKGDPMALERFAEKVRNYLFELSRIGDHSDGDIIAMHKLAISERQAWNERRAYLTEDQLASSRSWFCDRAVSYQNAYDKDPTKGVTSRTSRRQVHHQLLQTEEPQRCAKCQSSHLLDQCPEFAALSVNDRVEWVR